MRPLSSSMRTRRKQAEGERLTRSASSALASRPSRISACRMARSRSSRERRVIKASHKIAYIGNSIVYYSQNKRDGRQFGGKLRGERGIMRTSFLRGGYHAYRRAERD